MISGLNHITISVSDLDRSMMFYQILGFEPEVKWNSGAYLSIDKLWLCLELGSIGPRDEYSHIAFSIDQADYDQAAQLLMNAGVQQWQSNSSEGDSMYIQDPDGYKLEIHIGDLESRLDALRNKPYDGLEWL